MQRVVLGRTGLSASVMGLGAGGPSRIGQETGQSESDSIRIVREALDLGVNLIDTAASYGTEELIGKALQGVERSSYILSTKMTITDRSLNRLQADSVQPSLDRSLRQLRVDCVDIFHLHAVRPQDYAYSVEELVPELQRQQAAGKIRFLGITEVFNRDKDHRMLPMALEHDCWDVFMIGFNILNQSARERIMAKVIARNIGTLVMFAVRRALSRPEHLRKVVAELIEWGKVDPADLDGLDNPLGFLTSDGVARSIPEAAYRFCRDEPGMHVVLAGTGDPVHLRENAAALQAPPLPPHITERLRRIFARVDDVTGE